MGDRGHQDVVSVEGLRNYLGMVGWRPERGPVLVVAGGGEGDGVAAALGTAIAGRRVMISESLPPFGRFGLIHLRSPFGVEAPSGVVRQASRLLVPAGVLSVEDWDSRVLGITGVSDRLCDVAARVVGVARRWRHPDPLPSEVMWEQRMLSVCTTPSTADYCGGSAGARRAAVWLREIAEETEMADAVREVAAEVDDGFAEVYSTAVRRTYGLRPLWWQRLALRYG